MNHCLPTTVSIFVPQYHNTRFARQITILKMASNWQKSNEAIYSSGDLSSSNVQLLNSLTAIELHDAQQNINDFELRKQTLIEEVKEKFSIFLYRLKNLFSVHH
jgi:hypothetical protein